MSEVNMPADSENTTPPSTSGTSTTTFSCNVSLPPKIEIRCENLCKEWKQWRQIWDAYEEVTELRNKTSRLRVATFITCIGKEALEVHNGLPFQSDEEKADINMLFVWKSQPFAAKCSKNSRESKKKRSHKCYTQKKVNQLDDITES